jgi:hypothetical protein
LLESATPVSCSLIRGDGCQTPTALKRRPPMPLTLQAIADEVIEQL